MLIIVHQFYGSITIHDLYFSYKPFGPYASFAPLVNTIYSTLMDDKTMQGCFLLPQVMGLDPSLNTYLMVGFLSCKSLAQLALENLMKIFASPHQ
jgi:hypothetical protein